MFADVGTKDIGTRMTSLTALLVLVTRSATTPAARSRMATAGPCVGRIRTNATTGTRASADADAGTTRRSISTEGSVLSGRTPNTGRVTSSLGDRSPTMTVPLAPASGVRTTVNC